MKSETIEINYRECPDCRSWQSKRYRLCPKCGHDFGNTEPTTSARSFKRKWKYEPMVDVDGFIYKNTAKASTERVTAFVREFANRDSISRSEIVDWLNQHIYVRVRSIASINSWLRIIGWGVHKSDPTAEPHRICLDRRVPVKFTEGPAIAERIVAKGFAYPEDIDEWMDELGVDVARNTVNVWLNGNGFGYSRETHTWRVIDGDECSEI